MKDLLATILLGAVITTTGIVAYHAGREQSADAPSPVWSGTGSPARGDSVLDCDEVPLPVPPATDYLLLDA